MLIDEMLFYLHQRQDTMNFAEGLSLAVRFQVDNVARYIHDHYLLAGKRTPYSLEEHIPNIAPLAPVMWFEYNAASVSQNPGPCGCLISVDYDRDRELNARKYTIIDLSQDVRWVLRAEYFYTESFKQQQGLCSSDWIYYLEVAEDGHLLEAFTLPSQHFSVDTPPDYQPDENQRQIWHEETYLTKT